MATFAVANFKTRTNHVNNNLTKELYSLLDQLEGKVSHIESSPMRTFELMDSDTITQFHYYNLRFKDFWKVFDRNSARQLLQLQKMVKKHSLLSDKYLGMFEDQLDYLQERIDLDGKARVHLAPAIFIEEEAGGVISF